MDFTLSEEQLMLKDLARDFAEKEIRPVCQELDKKPDPADAFDWDLIKKASQLGFRTASFPREYGGQGLDLLSVVVIVEQLSWGDGGVGHAFFQLHTMGPIAPRQMSEELREEVLPKIIEDDTCLLGFALTETSGATEYTLPYDMPGAAFQTFAENKGDEWVLNGTKLYCSGVNHAKMVVINAQTDRNAPLSKSWAAFLLPTDTPGLSIGKCHDHMGMRLLQTSEVILDNVRVPARYMIHPPGVAIMAQNKLRPVAVTIHNSQMLGILQALYDEALSFARDRVVCGKAIIEHPTIKVMLAKMRMNLEAARGLLWRCAWGIDYQKDDFDYYSDLINLTKAFLDEIALTIMRDTDEIHGGPGTNKEMLTEKLIRDAFTMLHWMNTRTVGYLKGAPT